MFMKMAFQFNSPLWQIENYSSPVPFGLINRGLLPRFGPSGTMVMVKPSEHLQHGRSYVNPVNRSKMTLEIKPWSLKSKCSVGSVPSEPIPTQNSADDSLIHLLALCDTIYYLNTTRADNSPAQPVINCSSCDFIYPWNKHTIPIT